MATIGLLVVAAMSVSAGSGRKPAEEVQVSMRHISTGEAMDILRKFPELIPDYLAKRKDDAEYMAGMFGFVEVTIAPLARVFPTARFYRGHDFYSPPHPYLMAIDRGKRYPMPYGFNHLLIDNGLKVTDKNMIELAKAFVTVAIGEGLPKVTFLQATRTKQVISGRPYSVRLEIQTDEQTEEWFFSLSFWHDQFGTVYRRGPRGYITQYDPATEWPSSGERQSNVRSPNSAIDAIRMATAQAVRDSLGTGLASGSEPQEGQEAKVSMRRLSTSEVMDILGRFPGLIPEWMAWAKNDTSYLVSVFEFSEVTTPLLRGVFPTVRFYKGRGAEVAKPPIPYLMAAVGDKYCLMPGGFNRLLADVGLKVRDKNIMTLAKAFVVLAVGSRAVFDNPLVNLVQGRPGGDELLAFPDVTFGEGRKIAEVRGGTTYDARLKVKVDGREEEWWFDVKYGQFALVSRGNDKGLILQYMPKVVEPVQR